MRCFCHPSRRDVLRQSAALVAAGQTIPAFLARTARAAGGDAPAERILVVVQLTGGNDGLNTVVPYADDLYYQNRPTIAVPRRDVLKLDDHVGLHPNARGLKQLFDDGWLGVLQNVGYPNPDRSHFSAMDIWHSADPSQHTPTGWLGRAADREIKKTPGAWAVHIDAEAMPLALRSEQATVPSVNDISSLRLDSGVGGEATARLLRESVGAPRTAASDSLLYVQRAAVAAVDNARRLESLPAHADGAGYPATGLARRLRDVAALISAGFGARVYYTSLGGFDTHAKQLTIHGGLMSELGDALRAFFADLKSRDLAQRVLVMTFSEFGRRVKENGSQGTDHGAALPMFLAGPAVQSGLVGAKPDLTNLLEGDLRHTLDFRSVYATLLEKYLGIDSRAILGRPFSLVPVLR